MGAVCGAAGDGGLGTLVQGAACATRPGDYVHLEDTMAPTVAIDRSTTCRRRSTRPTWATCACAMRSTTARTLCRWSSRRCTNRRFLVGAATCAVAVGPETLAGVWPTPKHDKLGYVAAHHPEDQPARKWSDPFVEKALRDSAGVNAAAPAVAVAGPLFPWHVMDMQHKAIMVHSKFGSAMSEVELVMTRCNFRRDTQNKEMGGGWAFYGQRSFPLPLQDVF